MKTYTTYTIFTRSTLLRIENVSSSVIIMIPLAFSIGSILNVFMLWLLFQKEFLISDTILRNTFRQSFLASVGMGFVAHQFLRVFDDVFDINTFIGIFLQGSLAGLLGVMAWVVILKLIKNKEIAEVQQSLKHKFWKEKPIAPNQGKL